MGEMGKRSPFLAKYKWSWKCSAFIGGIIVSYPASSKSEDAWEYNIA